tara:strand:+ start:1168 stop:1614 length:447 start_codon:yes stop_codon:yes gene_type:complete
MKVNELKNISLDRDKIINLLENKTCFIAVFSESCIHCTNMKPAWNNLKNILKKIKSKSVVLEIDANQLDFINYGPLKNSIRGFPAIMIFKNGIMFKDYTGNRKTPDMLKFFKPHLEKANKKTIKIKKTINKKTKQRNKRLSRRIKLLY